MTARSQRRHGSNDPTGLPASSDVASAAKACADFCERAKRKTSQHSRQCPFAAPPAAGMNPSRYKATRDVAWPEDAESNQSKSREFRRLPKPAREMARK